MGLRDLLPLAPDTVGWRDTLAVDILMLTCMSAMGFMMTKEYRTYWSHDTFSKRVLFLRTMPIRVEELVLGRFQTLLVSLLSISIIFFGALYFIAGFRDRLDLLQYVEWIILWLCFGIIMGGFYVYAELGGSGKRYMLVCSVGGIGTILLAVVAGMTGLGIVIKSVELVERFGILVPLLSLLLTVPITMGWIRMTERRVRSREYSR